jgi:hypothetical protein
LNCSEGLDLSLLKKLDSAGFSMQLIAFCPEAEPCLFFPLLPHNRIFGELPKIAPEKHPGKVFKIIHSLNYSVGEYK